jgi:tetratricopeptide (TPR) repeat protein
MNKNKVRANGEQHAEGRVSGRDTRVVYDYIHALAWLGIIVAAVIDFFNASGKMGKGVDLAADISWALMNLLIAAYALSRYRRRWGAIVALGGVASALVVAAFCLEYALGAGFFVAKIATGANLSITILHLILQFKFYSREPARELVEQRAPELLALDGEKERALAGDVRQQYDVAMNLLGRATATHTSTHGSMPHYDAALELLEHAWSNGHFVEAKYQLAQIFEGRYIEAWIDKKQALQHYRELLKYFNGKEYQGMAKDERKSGEKIEKAVRKRLEK